MHSRGLKQFVKKNKFRKLYSRPIWAHTDAHPHNVPFSRDATRYPVFYQKIYENEQSYFTIVLELKQLHIYNNLMHCDNFGAFCVQISGLKGKANIISK